MIDSLYVHYVVFWGERKVKEVVVVSWSLFIGSLLFTSGLCSQVVFNIGWNAFIITGGASFIDNKQTNKS